MPELPEVEIVKRGLERRIVGLEIESVEIRLAKIFQGDHEKILNSKITQIQRHAKMLEIDFANSQSLLIHLKMTGQLIFDQKDTDKRSRVAGGHPSKDWVADLPNQFTHVVFHFKGGGVLYFNDIRRFGYIKVFDQKDLAKTKEISSLGPSPFAESFDEKYLLGATARRPKLKIKQLLMDQSIIAGIGNIYADESLFCAGISPLRMSSQITKEEFSKLIKCIRGVLELALEHGGSSENTFVNTEGERGGMQNFFKVYRQTGQDCPNGCGKIKRIVVGGRGTHYCPACQK
ncbi:MAG: Formamidopyrimidine-DNA glycosylase [candidate division WS2 bacterium ADurb.Bin280]|uniref:Formamidopyrimidine-DNA glycosylase n=1 Tax=candidate division WS2 bacterium ADurb.Bin280 TaxID=1852829 RepID=A0A1V5SCD6_9BACT|nr:MAG: Formamidopyrimidine-DNA glycosylase [candidate division WS2 bacterium ADurb.Bin280]